VPRVPWGLRRAGGDSLALVLEFHRDRAWIQIADVSTEFRGNGSDHGASDGRSPAPGARESKTTSRPSLSPPDVPRGAHDRADTCPPIGIHRPGSRTRPPLGTLSHLASPVLPASPCFCSGSSDGRSGTPRLGPRGATERQPDEHGGGAESFARGRAGPALGRAGGPLEPEDRVLIASCDRVQGVNHPSCKPIRQSRH
jgi:hypothetical protein